MFETLTSAAITALAVLTTIRLTVTKSARRQDRSEGSMSRSVGAWNGSFDSGNSRADAPGLVSWPHG